MNTTITKIQHLVATRQPVSIAAELRRDRRGTPQIKAELMAYLNDYQNGKGDPLVAETALNYLNKAYKKAPPPVAPPPPPPPPPAKPSSWRDFPVGTVLRQPDGVTGEVCEKWLILKKPDGHWEYHTR